MPRITFSKEVYDSILASAIGQYDESGDIQHADGSVTVFVDDEVADILGKSPEKVIRAALDLPPKKFH